MSVRKREWKTSKGDVRTAWIFDGVDKNGHRHIETFATQKEAKEHAARVSTEVKRGTHVAPSKSATVTVAVQKWLDAAETNGLERATLVGYRTHAKRIIDWFGDKKLGELRDDDVEAFSKALLENESRPLAAKILVSLRTMLKVNKFGYIGQGVTIKIPKRHQRKLEVGRDIPTIAEVKRMVTAATDTRTRAVLLLAAFTGLRSSELRGLRWSDVDLKKGEVHVRQRADRFYEIGSPKSEGSRRKVPLDLATVGSALKAWKLECPKFESDLVFPDTDGTPLHHEILLRMLWRTEEAVGIRNRYGLHAMRHFFASWCINPKSDGGRELPPKSVQTLMGHSTIVMTLDVYGHLFPTRDNRDELAASMKELLA